MTKGQKVALKHAANAIEGLARTYRDNVLTHKPIELGENKFQSAAHSTEDRAGRPYASVYLARRAGVTPNNQVAADDIVAIHYGLNTEQLAKLDRVASSTHNITQRSQRVAAFLRRIAEDPTYVGVTRTAGTELVAPAL